MERKKDKTGQQLPQAIAVVGGGVAGIVAAYLLQRRHRVTLIEAAPRLGGHTHTVTIPDGPDAGTPVDTGFIVHNDRTYPNFRQFLQQLGVAAAPTDMSFGYWNGAGDYWAGTDLRERPTWYSIAGGSHSYVKAFQKAFTGKILAGRPVAGIRREQGRVLVRCIGDGEAAAFDAVVVATHADQAFRLLDDPSEEETRLLAPWRYSRNETVLHTDTSWLPPRRTAWACWNYLHQPKRQESAPLCVSYYMNRLQQLETERDYVVTLNPQRSILAEHRIAEMVYEHPLYTFASLKTQRELPALNGVNRTFFCGSYFAHGFHEDAVRAAVEVAEQFDIEL